MSHVSTLKDNSKTKIDLSQREVEALLSVLNDYLLDLDKNLLDGDYGYITELYEKLKYSQ